MKFPTFLTALTTALAATEQPQVDLGYDVYKGVKNELTGLNTFKGIRFAAPPTGSLRWQPPRTPDVNRTSTVPATSFGAACPQSLRSGLRFRVTPSPIDEDCLFLNVYAPTNASDLPVLVWIHGGGYGVGDGREDMSKLINANNNSFVGVSIQYRLGAFGFLAGDEVFRHGVVNAGLLDQQFALQWIQQHIHGFGGDARNVTIWGTSAGGGSVMLHNIAYGGTQGTSLFTNSISVSPFLPQQYGYADWIPSQSYYAFAAQAGCFTPSAYGNNSQSIFQCLVSKDTKTLQDASGTISKSGRHGTWAFLPVTDGIYIQSTPSSALHAGKLNGLTHLTSNAAEEGPAYVPQSITTQTSLDAWKSLVFPLFTPTDLALLAQHYPTSPPISRYPTPGTSHPTALDTSATASGHQQTANLIYAESTFICSSHWLAHAYTTYRAGGYKFQVSTPVALHGVDDTAVFDNKPSPIYGRAYVRAVQRLWGAFVTSGSPALSANGELEGWGAFTYGDPVMANWNQSGGVLGPADTVLIPALEGLNATWSVEPGLETDFSVVDGNAWEGGRGARCEFWRSVAARVPM
ncbi:carboxylesterase type B [Boeremia exigua]|uniref:carboxylesterase type B n=1 Tax=Boeremia exigua TaxID=749465 RepID=UPI001E8E5F27|nr:carboxylesterase type B [Boeremia exigua]KAH6629131.1 carboxylesterase type B [Boeremia exigua]